MRCFVLGGCRSHSLKRIFVQLLLFSILITNLSTIRQTACEIFGKFALQTMYGLCAVLFTAGFHLLCWVATRPFANVLPHPRPPTRTTHLGRMQQARKFSRRWEMSDATACWRVSTLHALIPPMQCAMRPATFGRSW